MPDSRAIQTSAGQTALAQTGLEHANQLLRALREALRELLAVSGVRYEDVNANASGVVFVGWNKWQWTELPDEVAPLVGEAREALRRLREFSSNAAKRAPDRAEELGNLDTTLERLIEQPNGSHPKGAPRSTIDDVRGYATSQLDEYRAVIGRLPTAHGDGERLLIADTSALLDRPDLQSWTLDGGTWTLILFPQVHSELDDRKRDPRTRDAAQKVINQIEEFDRRGDTFAGVPLAGDLMVREVAISPDMSQTLPWLRADVPDDALIAGALELVWRDLTARIAITASDRNVRNKARLAGIGVIHPDRL